MFESAQDQSLLQTLAALKQCGQKKDFGRGKAIHMKTSYLDNQFVVTSLITMYSKCRKMVHARALFNNTIHRTVASWTSLILGYVENDECILALDLFSSMDSPPNFVTYIAAFKACAGLSVRRQFAPEFCLEIGIALHKQARYCSFTSDVVVASTVVDMYTKCASMLHARTVFDNMSRKTVVTWSVLTMGYVENDNCLVALDLFTRMDSCERDRVLFVAALKACGGLALELDKLFCLDKGIEIHRQVVSQGLEADMLVANTLVDMYSKVGSILHSRAIFSKMTHRNFVSWTNFLLGLVENGYSAIALDMFTTIDCELDSLAYVAVLKACSTMAAEIQDMNRLFWLEKGIKIHRRLRQRGYDRDIFIANTLVDLYSKCGSMRHAQAVFDGMRQRNVVSWNTLMLGYVETGEGARAMDLFTNLDCQPNSVTFVAALKASGSIPSLQSGRRIHAEVRKLGLEQSQVVATSLVDFYGKCGRIEEGEQVFRRMISPDMVAWTALIAGYCSLGRAADVVRLVKEMEETGIQPNELTFRMVLTACAHAGLVDEGKKYFESMSGYNITPTEKHYTCMVDVFGRANRLQEALAVVENMPFEANSVLWTSLLGACIKWRSFEVGTIAFAGLMKRCSTDEAEVWTRSSRGMKAQHPVNQIKHVRDKYILLLQSCLKTKDLPKSRELHRALNKSGHIHDVFLANLLVHLYSQCGSLENARSVFKTIRNPNMYSWNIMLQAYAHSGHIQQCSSFFLGMPKRDAVSWSTIIATLGENREMRSATKLFERVPWRTLACWNAILTTYAHNGHMSRACELFHSMPERNVLSWTVILKSYADCGMLDMTRFLFKRMPERSLVSWNVMLAAYAMNGYLVQARALLEKMPRDDLISCGTMLTAYAEYEQYEEAEWLFMEMKRRSLRVWNCLAAAYAQGGYVDKAEILFERMPRHDIITWNVMLKAYAIVNQVVETRLMFEKVPERDVVSWNTLMRGYGKAGLPRMAADVFDYMPSWSVVSWVMLLELYTEQGASARAWDVFMEMPERDNTAWYFMLDSFRRSGEVRRMRNFFDRTPWLTVSSGNRMAEAYEHNGMRAEARKLYQSLPFKDEDFMYELEEEEECRGRPKYMPFASWLSPHRKRKPRSMITR